MRFIRGIPLHLVFFVAGIILPTLVLSFFSFRSIRSEVLLAEKKYEEEQVNFRKAILDAVQKETSRALQDVRRKSQYLFDRPRTIEDLGRPVPLAEIEGIQAIFLFNGNQTVYPPIPHKVRPIQFPLHSPTPQEKRLYSQYGHSATPQEMQNPTTALLLHQLRYFYQIRHYVAAFRILNLLEKSSDSQGYLTGNLTESIWLMRFNLLVESGRHKEAELYCLDLLQGYLTHQLYSEIAQLRFMFETMFNTILSFERLDNDQRELFWNLRSNLNAQLEHTRLYNEHLDFIQRVLNEPHLTTVNGVDFRINESQYFFILSHPWLPGNQMAMGLLDSSAFNARILKQIRHVSREWKQIRFSILDMNDSLLDGFKPGSQNQIITRIPLSDQYPRWNLAIYQKEDSELRKESRNKMILLYTLVGFSLLIIILGSVFVFQGLTQERRLLSMKANFLSSVSHELKTPPTSIKMFADMIAGGRVQKAEKVLEYSGLIGQEATRLEKLIAAILNYTRMEHGTAAFRWEIIDLSALALKVFQSVDSLGKSKGLELESQFQDNCWIMGDYTSLYSLVQNLTDNAIKYTPPPGTIHVRVIAQNEWVEFSVTDSGVGIPVAEQKNIFKDFYRVGDELTRSSKGSGLGLAIVKRAAEAHRASIQVHSRPGKGSTFTVRFKRAENAIQDSGG